MLLCAPLCEDVMVSIGTIMAQQSGSQQSFYQSVQVWQLPLESVLHAIVRVRLHFLYGRNFSSV